MQKLFTTYINGIEERDLFSSDHALAKSRLFKYKKTVLKKNISSIVKNIQKRLIKKCGNNLKAIILYGSWAKGTASKHSDIDIFALFEKADKKTKEFVNQITSSVKEKYNWERDITTVISSLEDFLKEKNPLYTAVKREGMVLWGDTDLSVNPEPPEKKYSDFFAKSRQFESRKVSMAEELLRKGYHSGITDLCFIPSKHAIQASLAMKGEGYSSKVAVLLPLARRYFGEKIGDHFNALFKIYTKSEYEMEILSPEEAGEAVKHAKEILKVYDAI